MNVIFVTPSLNTGGAERFMLRLASSLEEWGIKVTTVCLAESGDLTSEFTARGLDVRMLELNRHADPRSAVRKVSRIIGDTSPLAVQGFMYLGDAMATAASLRAQYRNLFWSIRTSTLPRNLPLSRRILPFALAPASHVLPRKIISCSPQASRLHIRRGYADRKIVHIPNSVEEWALKSHSQSRLLTGEPGPIRIGMAARYDPGKGHIELVRAVGMLRTSGIDAHATFIGRATGPGERLENDLRAVGLSSVPTSFGGLQASTGVARWMAESVDLYVMASSDWEAFPNSLAEAVCCGTPAIASDVGAGWSLVPPAARILSGQASVICAASRRLIAIGLDERRVLFEEQQGLMRNRLSPQRIASRYLEVWR
jgi:glycosyltransferase involved in cell wall biosynthesis